MNFTTPTELFTYAEEVATIVTVCKNRSQPISHHDTFEQLKTIMAGYKNLHPDFEMPEENDKPFELIGYYSLIHMAQEFCLVIDPEEENSLYLEGTSSLQDVANMFAILEYLDRLGCQLECCGTTWAEMKSYTDTVTNS